MTLQKEQGISQKAKDVAAGAGESDLRRLKRQFASLKNTYMLYDTKEHFLDGKATSSHHLHATLPMLLKVQVAQRSCCTGKLMLVGQYLPSPCAGLLDGLPDGQEEESLRELEERVKAQGAKVKQGKAGTAEVRSPSYSMAWYLWQLACMWCSQASLEAEQQLAERRTSRVNRCLCCLADIVIIGYSAGWGYPSIPVRFAS